MVNRSTRHILPLKDGAISEDSNSPALGAHQEAASYPGCRKGPLSYHRAATSPVIYIPELPVGGCFWKYLNSTLHGGNGLHHRHQPARL